MKDGILRRGRRIGHADAKGRIRERDSRLRKGRELGYVDDKHRVRRRKGRFGRPGDVVARIRGNAVYGRDTVLSSGPKLGHIDERGNVWQADCQAFRGRIIGRARGADPESALAYFALKFEDVATHVDVLEEKIRASEDPFAFLPRVRATRQLLPEVDALGQFDLLFEKLDDLEELCVVGLGEHFRADGGLGRILTEGVTIDGLRKEMVALLGGERRAQVDALLYRARGAVDAISEGRIPTLADLDGPPEPEPEPEPERYDPGDLSARGLTRASIERLRTELTKIAQDPTSPADELVERARRVIGTVLDAAPGRAETSERRPSATPPASPSSTSSSPASSVGANGEKKRPSVLPTPIEAKAQLMDYVDGVLNETGTRATQVRDAVEQRIGDVRDWQRSQGDKVSEWRDKLGKLALGEGEDDPFPDSDDGHEAAYEGDDS